LKRISPVGDMTAQQTIILDLTGESARICVVDPGNQSLEISRQLIAPCRVAVRDDEAGIRFFAGNKTAHISEDDRTLIFDNLPAALLGVDDNELQSELALAFWNEICDTLLNEGLLKEPVEAAKGYVIPNHRSPPDLLERIRTAWAKRTPCIAAFCHEAISLVMGFLQSNAFSLTLRDFDYSVSTPICLFAAGNKVVDVACFDYLLTADAGASISLRNYFHTSYNDLFRGLKHSNWSDSFSVLYSLETPDLPDSAREVLDALFAAVWTDAVVKKRLQMPELQWLKAQGAAYIASCCSGRGASTGEYTIETAWNIGVRLDHDSFHPLITSKKFEEVRSSSHSTLQTFKLQGHPGNEMLVQLYCGFSDRVEDSTLLGQLTLSQPELASLSSGNEKALAVVLKLDTHGSGEFTLGLLPGDRIVSSMPFALPGLVI